MSSMKKPASWDCFPVPEAEFKGIRLNKHIADSGYCARRKADELIASGRVRVNGKTVMTMGYRIDPQRDVVTIDSKALPNAEKIYLAFHKPVGTVTSRKAGREQKSIYALLPDTYQAVDPAGRLDQDSSGLLILSSDGDFLNRITHPRYHLPKLYEIKLDRPLTDADKQRLKDGLLLQPENKLACMVDIANTRLASIYHVTLVTGYNRQIRRSLEALNIRVIALKRLAFGPVNLDKLAAGETRALSEEEIQSLLASTSNPASPA